MRCPPESECSCWMPKDIQRLIWKILFLFLFLILFAYQEKKMKQKQSLGPRRPRTVKIGFFCADGLHCCDRCGLHTNGEMHHHGRRPLHNHLPYHAPSTSAKPNDSFGLRMPYQNKSSKRRFVLQSFSIQKMNRTEQWIQLLLPF